MEPVTAMRTTDLLPEGRVRWSRPAAGVGGRWTGKRYRAPVRHRPASRRSPPRAPGARPATAHYLPVCRAITGVPCLRSRV